MEKKIELLCYTLKCCLLVVCIVRGKDAKKLDALSAYGTKNLRKILMWHWMDIKESCNERYHYLFEESSFGKGIRFGLIQTCLRLGM